MKPIIHPITANLLKTGDEIGYQASGGTTVIMPSRIAAIEAFFASSEDMLTNDQVALGGTKVLTPKILPDDMQLASAGIVASIAAGTSLTRHVDTRV